jgi:hypothetical protein
LVKNEVVTKPALRDCIARETPFGKEQCPKRTAKALGVADSSMVWHAHSAAMGVENGAF